MKRKRKQASVRPNGEKTKSLSEENVRRNPFEQFNTWFQSALQSDVQQPYAMALASAGSDGKPTARIVLLKGVDERGFSFYTNYQSVKGRQLSENNRAALLFYWPQLERQIRIEGEVERLTREESYEYFSSRPRDSKIGAWASHQSETIRSRESLDLQFRKYAEQFHDKDVPLPDYWGGFRLVPFRIEFWENRPNRLHDRISYSRAGKSWKIERLAP